MIEFKGKNFKDDKELLEYCRVLQGVLLAQARAGGLSEENIDHMMVLSSCSIFDAKMEMNRNKGRTGWHTEFCTEDDLKTILVEHVEKGDWIDVALISMMLTVKQSHKMAIEHGKINNISITPEEMREFLTAVKK